MESRRLVAILSAAIVIVLVLVFVVVPAIRLRTLPTPERAWVGVELEDSGVAVVGRAEIDARQPFRLHGILEAKRRDGESVFFTDAATVTFVAGARSAQEEHYEGDAVRPYAGPKLARVIWLRLQGPTPYLRLQSGEDNLDRLTFTEFAQPDWGRGWSTKGSLEARHDASLEEDGLGEALGFGTEHVQAWIELVADEKAVLPEARFRSPGIEELRADPASFSTVVATVPGALSVPTAVFGLTQIETPPDASEHLLQRLAEIQRNHLAFSQLLLLRATIEAAGQTVDGLRWQLLDWSQRPPWGTTVRPGDLLRVGARWVVLFRDVGEEGVLDPADLCLDYDKGAKVRALDAVFEATGDLEWARLAAR